MKPQGFLISAIYFNEPRVISFHVFETDMVNRLGELTDALELARENPEYFDILKDFDSELSVMTVLKELEYKVECISYE